MLQSIRDRTHGWIAGIIVSILILSFALWGIHSYLEGNSNNSVAAEVNGTEITKGQLAVAYERMRRQLQMQYSSNYELPANATTDLKDRALQTLVNIQVLQQASLKEKYRISSRQIDSYLQSVPEFQVDGQFSAARFQQLLATTLFNAKDFLDVIRTSLLIDQPRLGLIFTSFALPNEITETIALVGQERNIQYAVLPFQYFANQPFNISDAQVQEYYQQHEEEFKTPEQVSIEYIEFSINDLISTATVPDQKLKDTYNENVNSYSQPAQWNLEAILVPVTDNANTDAVNKAQSDANEITKKAVDAKDFAALVNSYNAEKVTDTVAGWVNIDKVPNELQKAVLALTKPKQISEPVRTKAGFVILKLNGYKEPQLQNFDKVKDKVKDSLARQQAQEKFADMKEKIANSTYEHPESLQPAAKALGLQIKSSELFTKDKGGKDISSNTKIREAAFSNDVLNLQNNSDVIQLNPDSIIVLRAKSHMPATLLSEKSVEKQIIEKLKSSEIAAQTAKLAGLIKDKLQNGTAPDDITKQYQLSWTNAGFIGRHTNKVDSAVLDTAFAMPKPEQGKVSYATTNVSNGYAVVMLAAVQAGTVKGSKEQYQVFGEQIQNSEGLLEYELYKLSVKSKAKVTIENS